MQVNLPISGDSTVERRNFLRAALATSAVALSSEVQGQSTGSVSAHEYYQLRKYTFRSGPQGKLADDFFSGALISALNPARQPRPPGWRDTSRRCLPT